MIRPPGAVKRGTAVPNSAGWAASPGAAMKSRSHRPTISTTRSGSYCATASAQLSRIPGGCVSPTPGNAWDTTVAPPALSPETSAGTASYIPESPRSRTVCGNDADARGAAVGALITGSGARPTSKLAYATVDVLDSDSNDSAVTLTPATAHATALLRCSRR